MEPKLIEILGIGCTRCVKIADEAEKAAEKLGMRKNEDYSIVKITDPKLIAQRGVLATPGIIIDGKLMSSGRVPGRNEIAEWLK